MRNFKQLKIWQKGFEIAINTFHLTRTFPKEEKYGLSSQRFLEIALGSSFETETQVLIAQAIQLGDNNLRDKILKDIDEEQKMIMSFMNKVSQSS